VNEQVTPQTSDNARVSPRGIPDTTIQPGDVAGLSTREAVGRRAAGRGNTAAPSTSRTYREIVTENILTFINLSIIALGVLLAVVGRPIDALLSGGAIAVNALVSIVQEVRAKRILDRIALLDRPLATVMRDGQSSALPPDELVVGDLLILSPGDQIVVDGRLLPGGPLGVDESALTGESQVVAKRVGEAVYSGSFCVSGRGSYVAEKVGSASFANRLMAGARARRRVVTPLQHATNLLIRILLLLIVYFEFLLLMEAVIKQRGFALTVENLALLAGLVPNGLLVSIALAYALGAIRVSRTGVLIQQSNAIESLSNVDVLCMDKTGTLTTNRLQVARLDPIGVSLPRTRYLLGTLVASMVSGNATSAAIATAFPQEPVRRCRPGSCRSASSASAMNCAPGWARRSRRSSRRGCSRRSSRAMRPRRWRRS
jgi:cation-transporting ATPase E